MPTRRPVGPGEPDALNYRFVSAEWLTLPRTMPGRHPPTLGQIQFKAGISDPVNTVLAWCIARAAGLYAGRASRSTSST